MMVRIGFKEEIIARQVISELNNVFQSPAYTVSPEPNDNAKIFIEVTPLCAEYVELNFKEYII